MPSQNLPEVNFELPDKLVRQASLFEQVFAIADLSDDIVSDPFKNSFSRAM